VKLQLGLGGRFTRHVSILGFNAKAQGREEAQGNHFFALLCELCLSASLR
jgi:hypothetical protein